MEQVMISVFFAEYEIDSSLGADKNQVDIAAFLRQRFPQATRQAICNVAEDLASQGSYVERIWPYIQGGC